MSSESSLLPERLERYERQLRLPGWRQGIISESTVLVAGVGALGCEISKDLALIGVGKLVLVDMDIVEVSNLNRQLLFRKEDKGLSKAETAARRLRELNESTKIIWQHKKLQDLPTSLYEAADVIACGLDNWQGRIFLNAKSVELNKPMVDGGTFGYQGHVRVIVSGKTSCLQCYNPRPPREDISRAACTLIGNPRERVDCLLIADNKFREEKDREPNLKNSEDLNEIIERANNLAEKHNWAPFSSLEAYQVLYAKVPSIITVNAVIANIQAQEVVKLLHQVNSIDLGNIMTGHLIYDGWNGYIEIVDVNPDPSCLICCTEARKRREKRKVIKVNADTTPIDLLQMLRLEGYQLIRGWTRFYHFGGSKKGVAEKILKNDEPLTQQGVGQHDTVHIRVGDQKVDIIVHFISEQQEIKQKV